MHLLSAQIGTVDDGTDPIDLAQTPGDIVVLTSADTEIAGLARACEREQVGADAVWASEAPNKKTTKAHKSLSQPAPTLRLTNLLQLSHNYSVDLYIEQTLKHAKLIIIRVLGGPSYWRYGLDEVTRLARANNIKLAVVSGSAYRDETLDSFSTLEQKETDQLWSYLVEGGPENYQAFLNHCHHLIDTNHPAPITAQPLPKAGIYWPNETIHSLSDLKTKWQENAPIAAITFYRALLQGDDLAPINALINSLQEQGLNPLPIFASSLKDEIAADIIEQLFNNASPDVIINTTSFAISNPGNEWQGTILDKPGKPVIQAILSGSSFESWSENARGLTARDIAMNISLPEIDGRLTSRAISFKADFGRSDAVETNLIGHKPIESRIDFVSGLATNWIKLAGKKREERNIALILSNYPATDGRIANGVGLDTPASTVHMLKEMKKAGYEINDIPQTGDDLIKQLQLETTDKTKWGFFSLTNYQTYFEKLPVTFKQDVINRWGTPETDEFFSNDEQGFPVRTLTSGKVTIGVQPGRGSGLDAKQAHHDATIPPPHHYIAFYGYLREQFQMDAIIHMGKHGNLEWLPGKALALSEACTPEIMLGPTPHIYPFIVNDPGEGAQAKRRTSAVIIDHLTPPLTRAESYGPLKDLESLVDEYYEAAGLDPRRIKVLGPKIIDLAQSIGLSTECGFEPSDCLDEQLQKLDNFLCELKELQIRDGLHFFGQCPAPDQFNNLIIALTRLPREGGENQNQSLLRAISQDLNLEFDPLTAKLTDPWQGEKPEPLASIIDTPWRTNGDTVERLELMAKALVEKNLAPNPNWQNTNAVLAFIENTLTPILKNCAEQEKENFLKALDGEFIEPGPSGAPTRGRADILPTGRNFYTIDNRTIPTETAWNLAKKSAENIIKTYTQEHGQWPKQIAMSAWGTSNMRTGGDDLGLAMRLIGTEPVWDEASRRVTNFKITPLSELKRPRVDVMFRISGFFRDAFPAQIDLLQSAINAVADLEEDDQANPIAASVKKAMQNYINEELDEETAEKRAKARIFGSAEMQYGAGLKELIHSGNWQQKSDLANAYINNSAYAYGQGIEGEQALTHFKALLKNSNLVVHNQDSREFDLLDSEDFYQFEGGLAAAIEEISNKSPEIYHNDHSNPENPKVQTLEQELAKIVRARAANPKWIESIMRHGAKGASEMLATVANLSAFACLTNVVKPHQFEMLFETYLVDEKVRQFLQSSNKPAMQEMAAIFQDVIDRGLWQPKRNSAYQYLNELQSKEERIND